MTLVPSSSRSDSSAVDSVTAGDASIVVGGTATLVTITTGRLDQVATLHAPTAAVPMNAQKLTGVGAASAATDAATLAATLDQFAAPAANVAFNAKKLTALANGSAATDAAAFGQITAANAGAVALSTVTAAGDLVVGTGNASVGRLAVGTAGQVVVPIGGVPAWRSKANTSAQPANPAGTNNTGAFRMMGLAGAVVPAATGVALITVSGYCVSSLAGDGGTIHIRYGLGAAPANGDAAAGAVLTNVIQSTCGLTQTPFSLSGIATGLALGSSYWIDLALLALTGGTFSVIAITLVAAEI